ncbi:MAG: ChbG/HpnK family deacetylase [Phycisphaerae bacterium]|nr:ChbG/HpnK family deacetylase [Phycisphaerae bacterium]
MPKKRLIINADGYGFTYGNNRGILEVLAAGAVRSISVNSNFPAVEEIRLVAERFPDVSIGIHLNLSAGKPVCEPAEVSSLIDESGNFWYRQFPTKALLGKLKTEHIRKELHAQIVRLKSFGIKISHWDSHQDRHLYLPFFKIALQVAAEHNIKKMRNHKRWLYADEVNAKRKALSFHLTHPRRFGSFIYCRGLMYYAKARGMQMADHFLSSGRGGNGKGKVDTWKKIFQFMPTGTSEITCHPGYPDETLRRYATMIDTRIKEAEALQDKSLLQSAADSGVELINFWQL